MKTSPVLEEEVVTEEAVEPVLPSQEEIRKGLHGELSRLIGLNNRVVVSARSQDPGDGLIDSARRSEETALKVYTMSSVMVQMDQITEALMALDNGTYGTCSVCGCQIPTARLLFLPSATMCVSCASRRR